MTDGPDWFAPKRYGLGSGMPLSWQGWVFYAVSIISIVVLFSFGRGLKEGVIFLLLVSMAPAIWLAERKTRGGWRWRWGKDD